MRWQNLGTLAAVCSVLVSIAWADDVKHGTPPKVPLPKTELEEEQAARRQEALQRGHAIALKVREHVFRQAEMKAEVERRANRQRAAQIERFKQFDNGTAFTREEIMKELKLSNSQMREAEAEMAKPGYAKKVQEEITAVAIEFRAGGAAGLTMRMMLRWWGCNESQVKEIEAKLATLPLNEEGRRRLAKEQEIRDGIKGDLLRLVAMKKKEGLTRDEIAKELFKQRWDPDVLHEVMAEVDKQDTEQEKPGSQTVEPDGPGH